MSVYQEALKNSRKFVIWGYGDYFKQVIDRIDPEIDILFVCDSNEEKWSTTVTDREFPCVGPDILYRLKNVVVLIAIKNRAVVRQIRRMLEKIGVPNCHINEAIEAYREKYEAIQIEKYNQTIGTLREPGNEDRLKSFISVSIPIQACQLRCKYCYIGQNGGFENDEVTFPSGKFIRKALSRKRLGGTALINFCGSGETLLCKELFLIVRELLEEGHYISIITNALLTEEIGRYLQIHVRLRKRLFFKCSFHYRQLKEKGLLELYAENVNRIWKSGSSVSVELVPEDELIPFLPEIKDFSLKHFGALPHVTVARDEGKDKMPIITEHSEEEYKKIWGQFDSDMFFFKITHMQKRMEYCTAGKNTFMFSLESGNISPCPREDAFYNIYNKISEFIDYREVGKKCSNPYCRNGHAYLALGIVEEVNECSYLQIRDRITADGRHWVNKEMAFIFQQRICDNQKENQGHDK